MNEEHDRDQTAGLSLCGGMNGNGKRKRELGVKRKGEKKRERNRDEQGNENVTSQ